MKLLAIPESNREEVRKVLETTPENMLEFSLIFLVQRPEDEDFDPELEAWAETHFETTLGHYAAIESA